MDRSIRILVANRPKLMRELILATLADEPGVELVGEVADEADIRARVQQTRPDLLVIALDEPAKRPGICDTLLRDNPGLRIIAVASQENCSVFYWASFDIHSSQIEASEQGITVIYNEQSGVDDGRILFYAEAKEGNIDWKCSSPSFRDIKRIAPICDYHKESTP